ncbi:MAG: hypothetical protein HWE27_16890 [Gammaproteobacteria bacterium]|nr:hypothetical protein [Gammaproteobacteria bacterium]
MKRFLLSTLAASFLGLIIYMILPPHLVESYVYWQLNKDEFKEFDTKLSESSETSLRSERLNVYPIFKAKNGRRVYFVGSLSRFGKTYQIAFIANSDTDDECSIMSFYWSEENKCEFIINKNWRISYEISSSNSHTTRQDLGLLIASRA